MIALSPADLHPLVLWHYPVVDGPPEESQLQVGGDDRNGDVEMVEAQ